MSHVADEGGQRVRVTLTDQALVAVTLARTTASAAGRDPHVADLLVALAVEPDGSAGRVLREREQALGRLADRAQAAAPHLAPAEVALRWAAGDVAARPVGTVDLLLAAVEVGGSELADLLDACALPPAALAGTRPPAHATVREATAGSVLVETFRLDPATPDLEPSAARALARTRAVGGGAVTLLAALAVEADTDPEAIPLDPDALSRRLAAVPGQRERRVSAGPDDWDAGLDVVLASARHISPPQAALRPLDLLRAAVLAGGPGPRHLLAPTEGQRA